MARQVARLAAKNTGDTVQSFGSTLNFLREMISDFDRRRNQEAYRLAEEASRRGDPVFLPTSPHAGLYYLGAP